MSMNLRKILEISRLQYLSDQNKLSLTIQRCQDLQDMNSRLDDSRHLGVQSSTSSTIQNQSFHWGRWIDRTQATINMERFTLTGQEEIARNRLSKSYGRYLAIKSIAKDN